LKNDQIKSKEVTRLSEKYCAALNLIQEDFFGYGIANLALSFFDPHPDPQQEKSGWKQWDKEVRTELYTE